MKVPLAFNSADNHLHLIKKSNKTIFKYCKILETINQTKFIFSELKQKKIDGKLVDFFQHWRRWNQLKSDRIIENSIFTEIILML